MRNTSSEQAGTITRLPSLLYHEESRFPLPSPGPRPQRDPGCHPGRGLILSRPAPWMRHITGGGKLAFSRCLAGRGVPLVSPSLWASSMPDTQGHAIRSVRRGMKSGGDIIGIRLVRFAGWPRRPDSVAHRLGLVAYVLLLVAAPRATHAQDESGASQVRYIEELKQRNAGYGPGCDGVGISVPAEVNMPADITSRWAAGHSACIPGMRLIMTCISEVTGGDRVVGCTLQVVDGQREGTITCDQLTLIVPDARFTPDATLSDALGEASEGGSRSCSERVELTPGTTVAAVFLVPARESTGDLAVTVDVDGSEVPAFLIPAGQLSAASSPES